MNYSTVVLSTLCLLIACGPGAEESQETGEQTGGSTAGPTGAESSGGAPVTGSSGDESTGEPASGTDGGESTGENLSSTGEEPGNMTEVEELTTGEQPPPVGPFTCMDARWVFVGSEPRYVRELGPDLRGHVLGHTELGILDVDPAGALALNRVFDGTPWWTTAGPDAAGNWFKTSVEHNDTRRRWLHKFDVTGALVWEVDLGLPANQGNIDVMAITVAPNGSVVLTDGEYVLYKFDAAGNQVWSFEPTQYLRIAAMNDAGQIAGLSPGNNPGLRFLDADGSELWQVIWDSAEGMHGRAAINASGEILIGSSFGASLRRYSSAGVELWHDWDLGGPFSLAQLAMNASGEIVAGGYSHPDDSALILRLDAAGAVVSSHKCNAGSGITSVAIDDAGVIYAGGNVDQTDFLPFIAVFD